MPDLYTLGLCLLAFDCVALIYISLTPVRRP